jgi:hypothetical protein
MPPDHLTNSRKDDTYECADEGADVLLLQSRRGGRAGCMPPGHLTNGISPDHLTSSRKEDTYECADEGAEESADVLMTVCLLIILKILGKKIECANECADVLTPFLDLADVLMCCCAVAEVGTNTVGWDSK